MERKENVEEYLVSEDFVVILLVDGITFLLFSLGLGVEDLEGLEDVVQEIHVSGFVPVD